MRKIFVCLLLIFIISGSFGQQTNSHQPLTREDYLEKSKKQKTGAWILLGGGVVMSGIAFFAITGTMESSFDPLPPFAGGALLCIGSVPLFIAAGKNKRKAMHASAYFEIQKNPVIIQKSITFNSSPSLSVKIDF